MKRVWVIVAVLFATESGEGQIFHSPVKSVYVSGGAYSSQFIDALSFSANPAVLADAQNIQAALSTERRWMLKELDFSQAACSFAAGNGGIGLLFHYTGNPDYNESALALAYGKNLGSIALGIQFRLDEDHVAGYGNNRDGSAMLGLRIHPVEKIFAGMAFSIALSGKTGGIQSEKEAGNYDMGFGYEVSPTVLLSVQFKKEAGIPINIVGCLDYRRGDQFYAAFGMESISTSPFVKAGWKKNQIRIEIFTAYHAALGFTPGVILFWDGKNKSG